jgi:hypothetical protein
MREIFLAFSLHLSKESRRMFDALRTRSTAIPRIIASVVLAHFLLVVAMAAAPGLHSLFHHDAGHVGHECAVTDMLSGGAGDGALTPPLTVDAILPHQFCSVAEFDPEWIASLFLTNRVLEHAPPGCA